MVFLYDIVPSHYQDKNDMSSVITVLKGKKIIGQKMTGAA